MNPEGIWTINHRKESSFLRKEAADFDFAKSSKKEIRGLVQRMREMMKESNGVGLSANQIGLNAKIFVAQVENKFYAIFNPKIISASKQGVSMEEGCLSVPETFGNVERPDKVILTGFDKNGKRIKIKAWGLLARIFQHEVDHLNGMLFIDKTKNIHKH